MRIQFFIFGFLFVLIAGFVLIVGFETKETVLGLFAILGSALSGMCFTLCAVLED